MYIFLDTETTGLADPRLVELAFVEEGHVPIVVRVKPPKPIELDASVVNGIRRCGELIFISRSSSI
jgi:DNA polymerase III epsilon subunit-like protein